MWPRALTLDLDGTLVDSAPTAAVQERACWEVAARFAGIDPVSLLEANAKVWSEYWPEIEAAWATGYIAGDETGMETWRRALRLCGCDDPEAVRFARDRHREHWLSATRLYDDARVFLELVPREIPLAVITNGASDTQREVLQANGLDARFAAIVISADLGFMKPDVRIFRAALDALGVGPGGAWHVGDNLATDVAGANAAGMTSVWLNRTGQIAAPGAPVPSHEIRSLTELTQLFGHHQPAA